MGHSGGHQAVYRPCFPEQRDPDPDGTPDDVQPPQRPQDGAEQECAYYRRLRLRQDPLLAQAQPHAVPQLVCGDRSKRVTIIRIERS